MRSLLAYCLIFCLVYTAFLSGVELPLFGMDPYIKTTRGKGVGYERGYTSIGLLFVPDICEDQSLYPMADVRLHYFDDSRYAGNVGLCLRQDSLESDRVFGYNIFYDFREIEKVNHQIGLGLEMFDCLYDLRFNAYLPFGNNVNKTGQLNQYIYPDGVYYIKWRSMHRTLYGCDIEGSTTLRRWRNLCCFDGFAAIGSYFYAQKCTTNTWGGRLRLGASYLNFLSVELKASYDNTYHTIVQGIITINFNLDRCFYFQPVERQEIITSNKCTRWDYNF